MSAKPVLYICLCATLLLPTLSTAVVINEIRIDQPGADSDEYVELAGLAGMSLDDLSYIVIGDQSSNQGYVEAMVSLSGYSIAADGLLLITEKSFSLNKHADLITTLNFENRDNVTHMLVRHFSGTLGTDIDSDDDGVIDVSLWSEVVDAVALLDRASGGDLVYSKTAIGPHDDDVPAHLFRQQDHDGDWQIGQNTIGSADTPGQTNQTLHKSTRVPEPSMLWLLLAGMPLVFGRTYRREMPGR